MKTNLTFFLFFTSLIFLSTFYTINDQIEADQKLECGLYEYHFVEGIINKELFLSLELYHQSNLANKILEAKKDPIFYKNNDPCWAPGTAQNVIDAYQQANQGVSHSLGDPSQNFNLAGRWTSTVTDGGGLGQGDVTTLRWSYVPDGAFITSSCGAASTSNFIAFMNGIYGSQAIWHQKFVNMFGDWATKSGLNFVYEPNDDGANTPGTPGAMNVRGDIRIAAHFVDGNSGILACNFYPGSGGDMFLDSGDNWFSNNSGLGMDNVLAHEVGHGIGIAHIISNTSAQLMEPFINLSFDGPQEDDILAANRHYGDDFEEDNTLGSANSMGAISVPGTATAECRSIDDNVDVDYHAFTVGSVFDLTATLTPTGTLYDSGVQNGPAPTPFDAAAIANLSFEIIDVNGATILGTGNSMPAGSAEIISRNRLPAGTYYARVQNSGENNVQMYELTIETQASIDCTNANNLVTNPAANFYNHIPNIAGTSVIFPLSAPEESILFTYELIAPGVLTNGTDINLTAQMNMTRLTLDNDPLFGFTNGANTMFSAMVPTDGIVHVSNHGVCSLAPNGIDFNQNNLGQSLCMNSCGSNIGDSYDVEITLDITGGVVTIDFETTQGAISAMSSYIYPQIYDVSQGIDLIIAKMSSLESYQLNSFCTGMVSCNTTMICPPALAAQCDITEQAPYVDQAAFEADGGMISSDCNMLNFSLQSEISDNNSCPETVTRIYQVVDENGEVVSCSQTVVINDTTMPTIVDAPAALDQTICLSDPNGACPMFVLQGEVTPVLRSDPMIPGNVLGIDWNDLVNPNNTWFTPAPSGMDNCGSTITRLFDVGFDTQGSCETRIIVNWFTEDPCGNTSALYAQIVTFQDCAAPIASCMDITVFLGVDQSATIIGTDVDNINNPSFDRCNTMIFDLDRDSFGCDDLEAPQTVTLSVTDACDNNDPVVSICTSEVTIMDPYMATFTLQPEPQVSCIGGTACFNVEAVAADPNLPLEFSWQVRNGAGAWLAIPVGDVSSTPNSSELCISDITEDMECWSIRAVAGGCPLPSDDAKLIVHTENYQMSCNDMVNVSLTDICSANFNAISFLEGERDRVCGIDATDYLAFVYRVEYITATGIRLVEGSDLSPYAGTCMDYEVTDVCFGTTCWGTVCLDDKILPELTCDCPVLGSSNRDAYDEQCRLKCYQKDLIQNGIESVVNTGSCNYVPFPLADDNCENIGASYNNPNLVHSDEWIEGDCGEWWLRRSFQLMTSVRNEATGLYENVVADECVYEFFVDSYNTVDTIGLNSLAEWNEEILPNLDMETGVNTLFLPIAYIELGCNRDVDPATLASLSGFDLPGNPAPSGDNTGTSGDIEVEENNEGIIYGYPFYFAKGAGCGFYTQRVAPDVCNIVADYTDQIIDSCGDDCYGNRKTLREWTILDWCEAELINWNQLIKTVDTTPPTMSVQNITVSVDPWTCSADALLPAPDFLHDDCDDRNLVYTVNNVSAITISGDMANGYVAHDLTKTMPGEPHVFFYEAADCCGNEAVYAMNVTVVDLTAPVPVTLQNIVLSLTSLNPDTSGIAKIFVDDIDNGSYDECSGVHLEIRRVSDVCGFIGNATYNNDGHADDDKDDPDGGQYVKFCCDDLDDGTGQVDVMLRVWDDADMDGFYGTAGDNYNESWVTVTVEDKLGGGAQCPPNLILTCDMSKDDLTMTGVPGANISTCSTSPVDSNYTDLPKLKRPTDAGDLNDPLAALGYGATMPPFDPVCRIGAIERTWASCGQQWIVFVDNGEVFDDETIVYPVDATVDCIDFELGEPSWEEVACQLIGYSLESDTFLFEDGACMKVLNHFTVINWCEYDAQDPTAGGIWSWTQTTKLIDTDRPTVEYTGETCFAVNVDCESDDVVLTMSGDDAGDCPSPWLKWEVVIDLWGDGSADHTYTSYTLTNSPYYIAPSARGEEISVTIPAGVEVSKVDHLVYITVGDGCGNVTSTLETIEIVDKKKPTPYCINLSTALMQNGEVELWACDFNEGSFDNCTASEYLRYTFSAVNPDTLNETAGLNEVYDPVTGCSSRVFTNQDMQDADAEGLIQVDMYAWDECGNYDFCTVNLRLINNQGRAAIEGSIQTEDGRDVKDVEVSIVSDSPEYPSSTMTDAEGHYAFSDNPIYADYTVSGEKNDDYLNGVSTLDVVMIQRHVLGLKELSSGYKLIAADINSDAKVSTIDLIELRKLILGIYSELPNNDSWRFASEAAVMNDENPWSFVEEISISGLSENMMNEDYVGIKIGDVNESVELGLTGGQSVDGRSKNLELIMDETITGDRVELAVRSSNFADIYGYQFTMEQSGMILEEVVSGAVKMDNSNVAQLDANTITVSWNNEHGVSATEDAVLFTMIFSGSGSELAISSRRTKAEAYSGSTYETMGVSLRGDDSYTNVLYQNEPNPFADLTQIAFELSSAGSVELSISDLSGKLLKVVRGDFASGYNVISISSEELGATGVMYYTLESGDFVATKKMVVIK